MATFRASDLEDLRDLRKKLSLVEGDFGFDLLRPGPDEAQLPTSEAEVNAFVSSRTKLWRETWILPVLDRLIARAERDRR